MIFGGYEINSLNDIDIFLDDFIDDKIKFNDLFILIPYIYLFNNLKNFKTYKYIEQNFYLNILYKFIVLLYYNKRKYKLLYFLNKKKDIKILYKNFLIDYLKITDDNLKNKKCKNIKNFFKKNKDYYLNYNTIEDIQYINDINIIKKDIDKFIKYLLNIYLYLCKIKKNRYTNNYIGLYQYHHSLCWFYSFLHCLCYSDLNKELIMEKLKGYEGSSDYFIYFVKYIIENITKDFKKSSEFHDLDNEDNENLFETIKSTPETILRQLYRLNKNKIEEVHNDYFKHNDLQYKLNILRSGNKNHREILYFFMRYYNKNIYDDNEPDGLSLYEEHIFIYLYNLLNIKVKLVYYIDNKIYSYDDDDENNYDIILLSTLDIKKPFNLLELRLNIKEYFNIILNKENKIINYKDNIYKLDCILSSNDKNGNKDHMISFINYNKKGYFINSNTNINDEIYLISKGRYKLPCFVKYDWLKNPFGNIRLCNDDKCNLKSHQYYKHGKEPCYLLNNNIYIFVKNNKLKSISNIKKTTSSIKKYNDDGTFMKPI